MFAQRISGPLSSDVVVAIQCCYCCCCKGSYPSGWQRLSLLCATFLTLQMQPEDRQSAGRGRGRSSIKSHKIQMLGARAARVTCVVYLEVSCCS